MNIDTSIVILGLSMGFLQTMLLGAVRFRNLKWWLPGAVGAVFTLISPFVLAPGDPVTAFVCLGPLLLVAFVPALLVAGYLLKRSAERTGSRRRSNL